MFIFLKFALPGLLLLNFFLLNFHWQICNLLAKIDVKLIKIPFYHNFLNNLCPKLPHTKAAIYERTKCHLFWNTIKFAIDQ